MPFLPRYSSASDRSYRCAPHRVPCCSLAYSCPLGSAHQSTATVAMMKHVLALLQVHTASAVVWRVCPSGCDFVLPSLAVRQAANGVCRSWHVCPVCLRASAPRCRPLRCASLRGCALPLCRSCSPSPLSLQVTRSPLRAVSTRTSSPSSRRAGTARSPRISTSMASQAPSCKRRYENRRPFVSPHQRVAEGCGTRD